MTRLETVQVKSCPVCGAAVEASQPFMDHSIDLSRITQASFASRKLPEYMSYRMNRCSVCSTVYATESPPPALLAEAYRDASYDSSVEAEMAASTYAASLRRHVDALPRRGTLLEIGTGTGVFLARMGEAGFKERIGIEPSHAAIAGAEPSVRQLIREGIFVADDFDHASISMICCFQTLEHIPNPRKLVEDAFELLEPSGLLALVTHNVDATLNRVLGRRSPIIDIEHLQLFSPRNLTFMLERAGFARVAVEPLKNTYPLRYWLRLAPVPMKDKLLTAVDATGVGKLSLSVNVGNILATAWKPVN